MIRNYLKVIFRSLGRMPSGSIINIFGMSVGIAISLLIMLYVKSEVTVNRGFKEYDNIYRISLGDGTGWQGTPARLGEILTGNLPEIRSFVRIDDAGSNHVIKVAGVPMRAGRVIYADSNFFRIFSLPFKYGEPAGCLSEKFNLVITESVSERLFKDENPVGRSVMFDGKFNARITGVIVDPGQETHINGNTFISFHSMPEVRNQPDIYDCYTCYNYETFLLLDGSADPSPTIVKINAFLDEYGTRHSIESLVDDQYSLSSMSDVYFGKEERPMFRKGNLLQLKVLASVGILILLIAIINYINLATAQGGSKLHQLALRKVMGAARKDLFALIIGEAVIVSLISVNTGLVLLELIRPLLNSILDFRFKIGYLEHPWIFFVFLLCGIIIGLLSGIYPALAITRFDIAGTMHGSISQPSSGGTVRRILTVLQVIVSIVLVGCTAVIYSQLRFINNADLGFDKEVLVYLPLNDEIRERKEAFRNELLNHSGIENVSFSYSSYRINSERWGFDHNDRHVTLHIETVDEHYLETLGLELVKGRNFRGPQDDYKIIVNEEACRQYFGEEAVGTRISALGDNTEIVGVVRDFRFHTFDRQVEPIGMIYKPEWTSLCNIRLSGTDVQGALDHMEKTWKEFSKEYPFEYHFVDELYESRYRKEQIIGELLIFFSVVSVILAGLGIFGLATFSVTKRSREVGIRKVNGASAGEVVRLLSFDINRIVLIALVPSLVLIGLIMNKWLSGFVYRINIPIWVYPGSVILVWLVALFSTIGKTIRTARINPADVLRME